MMNKKCAFGKRAKPHPKSATGLSLRRGGLGHADHGIAIYQFCERGCVQIIGSSGACTGSTR